MVEGNYPVTCFRASEFTCPKECAFYSVSATVFNEAMVKFQTSPSVTRERFVLEADLEDSRIPREFIDQNLRSTGKLPLCRSYFEGC